MVEESEAIGGGDWREGAEIGWGGAERGVELGCGVDGGVGAGKALEMGGLGLD